MRKITPYKKCLRKNRSGLFEVRFYMYDSITASSDFFVVFEKESH